MSCILGAIASLQTLAVAANNFGWRSSLIGCVDQMPLVCSKLQRFTISSPFTLGNNSKWYVKRHSVNKNPDILPLRRLVMRKRLNQCCTGFVRLRLLSSALGREGTVGHGWPARAKV
jgi:hypothetical protein